MTKIIKFTQKNVTQFVTVEKIKEYLSENQNETFFDGMTIETCLIAKYVQKVFSDKELYVGLSTVCIELTGKTRKEFKLLNSVKDLRFQADTVSNFKPVTGKTILEYVNSQISQ